MFGSNTPLPPAAQADPTTSYSSNVVGHQSLLGPWLTLTVFLPYFVATALQDTHLRIGLVVATGIAGAHLLAGALVFVWNARKVFPYILELTFVVLYSVLLGCTYSTDTSLRTIERNYNFIVHSTIAGVALISMVVTYPLGVQHVQELVPWAYAGHEDVVTAGYWTTGVLAANSIIACLLYLIPVCRGVEDEHFNVLNIIFRIVVPMVLIFIAVMFMRFWPATLVSHLQATQIVDGKAILFQPVYLTGSNPKIIDNAMYAHPAKGDKVDLSAYHQPTAPALAMQGPGMMAQVGPVQAGAGPAGRPLGQVTVAGQGQGMVPAPGALMPNKPMLLQPMAQQVGPQQMMQQYGQAVQQQAHMVQQQVQQHGQMVPQQMQQHGQMMQQQVQQQMQQQMQQHGQMVPQQMLQQHGQMMPHQVQQQMQAGGPMAPRYSLSGQAGLPGQVGMPPGPGPQAGPTPVFSKAQGPGQAGPPAHDLIAAAYPAHMQGLQGMPPGAHMSSQLPGMPYGLLQRPPSLPGIAPGQNPGLAPNGPRIFQKAPSFAANQPVPAAPGTLGMGAYTSAPPPPTQGGGRPPAGLSPVGTLVPVNRPGPTAPMPQGPAAMAMQSQTGTMGTMQAPQHMVTGPAGYPGAGGVYQGPAGAMPGVQPYPGMQPRY